LESVVINPRFWSERRVLVTGHTGFKGAWLCLWLHEMGAELYGYSLEPPTDPSLFEVARLGPAMTVDARADIRDLTTLEEVLRHAQPEVVFHLAAQSLVRLSYAVPVETFAVNVMGTANLLQASRNTPSVRAVLVVTSDKCYENLGDRRAYHETDRMGGDDPYSASKGCAEIVTSSFRSSAAAIGEQGSSIAVASARSGNVVGGGDYSPDRLVPDCIRAFVSGRPVKLRYPEAVRPWLHVLEPLAGYIMLAEKLLEPDCGRYASAFNFGPNNGNDANVLYVAQSMARLWGEGAWVEAAPGPHPPEAAALRLDASKSRLVLGWGTRWDLVQTLERVVEWYRTWHRGQDVRSIMTRQLADFTAAPKA
jgi:CDP-glucose 4,6-dehydratase